MEFKDVQLNEPDEEKAKMGAYTTFTVTLKDDTILHVPADPANRHYWEVREWFFEQSKKPFDFEFEPIPTGE